MSKHTSQDAVSIFACLVVLDLMVPSCTSAQDEARDAESALHVAVLGITSVDGDEEVAISITRSLRAAASEISLWSVSEREVTLRQAEEGSCPFVSRSCMSQASDALGVNALLYGQIRRGVDLEDDNYYLEIALFARQPARILAQLDRTIPMSSSEEAMGEVARSAVLELSHAAEEFLATATTPATPAAPVHEPQSEPIAWLGYTFLGVAAASLIATVVAWARLNDLSNDGEYGEFRRYVSGNACLAASSPPTAAPTNLIAHAQSVCDEGNTLELLQVGLLAASGVFAIAGSIFATF